MARDELEFCRSIDAVDRRQWNALDGGGNPFVRHEFLAALEHTHCVGGDSGWEPRYLALRDAHGLAAAATAFVKTHSYGEFVFDFAWAQAYERLGRHYYPKLTLATPFTPATAPRLLLRPGLDQRAASARLLEELEAYTVSHGFSGVHAGLLDEQARLRELRGLPAVLRRGQAQEGAARAPPGRRGRRALRDALRRRAHRGD